MKIGVVTPYFPVAGDAHRGHSAYQTALCLKRLADVEVVCPLATYPSWLSPRNFRYERRDTGFQPEGIQATYFEYPAVPMVSRPVNGLVCARMLMPYIREMRPDVLLNYWLYPEGLSATHVGRKLGIPVVVGAIGSDLRLPPDPVSRWWTERTMQRADAVLTVSEELRRRALEMDVSAEKVTTIPNGCDFSLFHPKDRDEARRKLGVDPDAELLVYVGRISVPKGMAELTEAMIALAPSRPHLKAALIGEGAYRSELESRAKAAGILDRFLFPGTLPAKDVVDWYAAGDIFCLPSHSEGCPNVIVEAIACGRPIVSTRVGGIPELVDDSCGCLTPPQDSRALAEALKRAFARQWDPITISRHLGRSWETAANDTFELCQQVLRRYRATA